VFREDHQRLQAFANYVRVRQAGLVRQRKMGRVRQCHLSAKPLRQAEAWLAKYRIFWGQQLDSLDRYLRQQSMRGQEATKHSRRRS